MGELLWNLGHLPPWLIFVFIVLVLYLARYARPRWIPIRSLHTLPILFVIAGAAGLVVHPPIETLAWSCCVCILAPAAFLAGPEPLAVDPRRKRLQIPGSIWSAVRLICVVSGRYALALAALQNSDNPALMHLLTAGFSGCVAGYYIGHSLRLLQAVRAY
jgi:hypothetical protein